VAVVQLTEILDARHGSVLSTPALRVPFEQIDLGTPDSLASVRLRVLGERLGISREKGRPADILQIKVQEQNSLETNATPTVRWASPPEPIEVVDHLLRVDLGFNHALLEHGRMVNTLTTGEDLLSADEEVGRVGQLRVVRVGHRVERPD
jgi:hypothetical protein